MTTRSSSAKKRIAALIVAVAVAGSATAVATAVSASASGRIVGHVDSGSSGDKVIGY
jgi:hypothetical protein